MSCGVISSSTLRSCCVGRIALQVDLLTLLAQRGDLALLEVGLGEDLAVHLDENLLDDFGADAGRRDEADDREDDRDGSAYVGHG